MKRLVFALSIMLCMGLPVLSYGAMQNVHVSGTQGSDTTGTGAMNAPYRSIQQALDSITGTAADPASIHIEQGVYNEEVTLGDYENLVKWFVALVKSAPDYTDRDVEFEARLRGLEKEYSALLRKTR